MMEKYIQALKEYLQAALADAEAPVLFHDLPCVPASFANQRFGAPTIPAVSGFLGFPSCGTDCIPARIRRDTWSYPA